MLIKNRTNSPYRLIDSKGNAVMLAAFGEVDIEPHPMHINHYKTIGYFDISDSKEEPTDRELLREEYHELAGKNASAKWSAERLQREIDKLKESDNG